MSLLSKQLQQDLHIKISIDEIPSLLNSNPCNPECIWGYDHGQDRWTWEWNIWHSSELSYAVGF